MSGWIKLWRRIRENALWRERRRFSKAEAWIDLLMEAAYEDHEQLWRGLVIPVKRGHYLITQGDLASRWKWNRETVRTFLRLLEAANMAAIRTSKETETGYTLITVVNYELYQGDGPELKDDPSAIGSAIGTSNDPASDQHPTATTEEVKKGKKSIADAPPASAGGDGKGPRQEKKPRKTHPETDTLLREFEAAFKAKYGEPYMIEWGRDRKLMGGLVATYGAASVRAKMPAFFKHGTRETRERRKWTVPEFRRVFPQLVAMEAMGDLG